MKRLKKWIPDNLVNIAMAISVIGFLMIILFALIKPFNGWGKANSELFGRYGDFIGGTVGSIFSLAAFYLVYVTFKSQNKQYRVDSFEKKLYTLIELHKQNVNEINIANKVAGRKAFVSFFYEYQFCFRCVEYAYTQIKNQFPKLKLTDIDFNVIAYYIFYLGLGKHSDKLVGWATLKHYDPDMMAKLLTICHDIRDCSWQKQKRQKVIVDADSTVDLLNKEYRKIIDGYIPHFKPANGHMSVLGHYYRHMFLILKTISDADFLTKTQKYEYSKVLRAQLSDFELLMLYFNVLTPLGEAWFTYNYIKDYRFLTNMPYPYITFGEQPITTLQSKGVLNQDEKSIKNYFEWNESLV